VNQLLISPKLRLLFLLPTISALAISIPLVWILTSRLIREEAAQQLLNALPVVVGLIEDQLDRGREELQDLVTGLETNEQVRITLIDDTGLVLADSSRSSKQVATMDDHSDRPEVVEALARGQGASIRRSDTTGLDYVYTAKTTVGPSERLFVVRLAQPVVGLRSLRNQLFLTLLLATLAVFGATSVLLWWFQRKISRATPVLLEAATRLEKGDFSQRVDFSHQAELGRIARFLNQVADSADCQIGDLETERSRLLSVLSSMREGVLVTDSKGSTTMANPAFCQVFGINVDWADRTPLELTHQRRLEELVAKTLATGEEQNAELELPGSGARHVAIATSSLGADAGSVVVARDITDLVHLTQMRRDFVANVSHELKTPLTAIRGYAETLRDGAVEDRATATRFLGRILQQCGRLQALLEDLLTLSRLETLEDTGEVTVVELNTLLQDCVETVGHQAAAKQVQVRVASHAEPVIKGDHEALERLLTNLLDNAVKYNRPGGKVTITLSESVEGAMLEVADTGIGIPSNSLARVFERFYRVDKGRSRDEGGTGLGLAIVKHVAHLHGGRVEVQSRLGEGSRFTIILPFGSES
jgi:two-component system phosphate regulon sensor histidine kinase PhoR